MKNFINNPYVRQCAKAFGTGLLHGFIAIAAYEVAKHYLAGNLGAETA